MTQTKPNQSKFTGTVRSIESTDDGYGMYVGFFLEEVSSVTGFDDWVTSVKGNQVNVFVPPKFPGRLFMMGSKVKGSLTYRGNAGSGMFVLQDVDEE